MTHKTRVALFDLDHTLIPIDSDYSWGVFTQAIGWADPVEFKQRNDEFYQHYKAGTGGHGMGKNRTGPDGNDVVLRVPVGTQIFEDDNETLIADFTEVGQRVVLLRGGNGGFGNAHFVSSTRQAPRGAAPANRRHCPPRSGSSNAGTPGTRGSWGPPRT